MFSLIIGGVIGALAYRFYCNRVCDGPGSKGCTCSR